MMHPFFANPYLHNGDAFAQAKFRRKVSARTDKWKKNASRPMRIAQSCGGVFDCTGVSGDTG
jgi:hypothetical protein